MDPDPQEQLPSAELPTQLNAQFSELLAELPHLFEPPAAELGLDRARRRFGALLACGLRGGPDVPSEEADLGGGLTGRIHRPADAGGATVVFLHGGGWTLGDVGGYAGLARRIAAAAGAVVLSVEYRRAPEHPFPAAVDDAVAGTRWALAHPEALGGDPRRVAVAGDSGGGNLAAVVCQQLRDAHAADPRQPTPAAQLLLYPNVARGADQPSVREFRDVPFLPLADMAWYTRQYVPRGVDLGDPRISPLEGSVAGLPPALVVTAGVDALHDSGRAYAEAIRGSGGRAEWLDFPDLPHGFAHLAALAPSADAALIRVLARLRELLHGAD